MLLHLLLVLCIPALLVNATCHFASLPGSFQPDAPVGSKWQLLTSQCALHNYLPIYSGSITTTATPHQTTSPSDLPNLSMLFIGDSTDFYLMKSFCEHAGGKVHMTDKNFLGYNTCKSPTSPSLTISQVYTPSLTRQHPVILPGYSPLPGAFNKTKLALKHWRLASKADPSVVVVGGGMWDIFRWVKAAPENLTPMEREVQRLGILEPQLLLWWIKELKHTIRFVQRTFPDSLIMWRSYATPAYNTTTGHMMKNNLGTKAMNADVRAAGKEAARELRLQVIDIDQMVQFAHQPKQYLQDHHHARPEVYLEVVNVILNVLINGTDSAPGGTFGTGPGEDATLGAVGTRKMSRRRHHRHRRRSYGAIGIGGSD